ncbi:PPE family protein [Mycobacterium intracellulare]|uniref:PPE family protein n=1 Tax=Mycobacterium intracellulare TaxID=1767 RepID=UPI001EEF5A81|nr:PPE family protein [Mycobacterium intracellulare]MEE3750272.1 PPE family protein [Mycobacterium intracellulare]
MDFATLPPEINSGLMYSGPGAGSMVAAAAAWDKLAAWLCTAAADYRAVTAKLAAQWEGTPSALRDAAALYTDWLDANAARSQEAAVQLGAAAGAHEAAFAATVPPPAIAGNRTRRTALVSANCLGQHSAAIADVDTEYDAMWARNAGAMYAYACAAANAVTMTPFAPPPADAGAPADTWPLKAAPEVVSAARQVMSAIPGALKHLSSATQTTFEASLASVTPSLSKLNSLTAPSDFAIGHLNSMNKAAALRTLFPKPAAANGVSARLGRGISLGALSVPRTWATAAPDAQALRGDRRANTRAWSRPVRHPAGEYGG